jgi:hypothetical protein
VIAAAGDTVREVDGHLSVNDQPLTEPYVSHGNRGHHRGQWTVPHGRLFVAGDNRAVSCDSRYWGPLPTALVQGKIVEVVRYGGVDRASKGVRVAHERYPYERPAIHYACDGADNPMCTSKALLPWEVLGLRATAVVWQSRR